MRHWLCLLGVRVLLTLLLYTWFVPDELFQSAEVAHRLVFGTGHLSWEWSSNLRSYLHPLFLALPLVLLRPLQPPQWLIAFLPHLIHAFLFSVGDRMFISLSKRFLRCSPASAAHFALLMYLSSWFISYCSPRSLSNSLECLLTLIALRWYPFPGASSLSVWPYMALGALTIVVRPTAVLIWLPLGLWHLVRTDAPLRVAISAVLAVLPVFAVCVLIDSYFIGRLTFVLWNFLSFNVLTGGSAHFGVHPWHWYLSQGLPSVLLLHLIPIVLSLFSRPRPPLSLFFVSSFYVIFHSLLAHKEQRFLLPILPFLSLYSGHFFSTLSRSLGSLPSRWKAFLCLLLFTDLVVLIYTLTVHQRGPYAVVSFLVSQSKDDIRPTFLVPCYSVPEFSYFHDRTSWIRSLDCSPNLSGDPDYVEEGDAFHANPVGWLSEHWAQLSNSTHFVIYEKYFTVAGGWLRNHGFNHSYRLFHSHFLTSSRQDHYMVVVWP